MKLELVTAVDNEFNLLFPQRSQIIQNIYMLMRVVCK